MPLTRIQPAGLDSTKDFTFNKLTTNTVIVNGVDVSTGGGPKITNVQVTNSSYTVLDDTAVALTGGYIKITGTGFVTGCQVLINNTPATSVSFVSATEVRAQVPATSAGTYVVYLVNPDGGVAIRVNGITFSGNPTWVTDGTLPAGQVNAAISIQLSSSGDAPITYALQAGSSLPAGLTLTSGGLLSGTVTGISVATTYNFTIEAIDAQSQESPRAFSITITASDENFKSTTLLLSADTPSSTFVSDASNNAFNITVNGDTRPNNFGPYTPGYYSNYFDGTGDYLIVPSTSSLSMGTGDFCIEMWIYPTALSATSQVLYANFTAGDTQMGVFIRNTSTIRFSSWDVAYLDSASGSIVANVWQHIVVCRASSTTSLFINGVRAATNTVTTNFSSSAAFTIGCNPSDGTQLFTGYISNLRAIKGSAVYNPSSTTIVVPTAPLTAIANTSLLTCQSNRFIDNSTNNFTITRNGDTTINGFDPFVPASDTATYGSGYFDGTGDYLATTTNISALGTGNFTFECWAYPTSSANFRYLFSIGGDSNFSLALNSGTYDLYFYVSATILSGIPINPNQWNHVALVRNSGVLTIYVNGVSGGTASFTNTVSAGIGYIGAQSSGSYNFSGYLSNCRLTNTAVYTANFTPPTSPLTAITNTSLLTLQTNQPVNNNQFVDNSTNNFLVTRNGNTTQGTFSPYPGTWSNYFDGTGDYLTLPAGQASLQPGSGDFTIEFWYNTSLVPNTYYTLFSYGLTGNVLRLFLYTTNSLVVFTGSTLIITANNAHQANLWRHVAIVRSGTTVTLYVNGTSVGTNTSNSTNYVGDLTICNEGANSPYPGFISNFRLVKGTAVYTSAFTPPTQPLTPITNTQLLTCADNRLIDDSNNNFTITRNGDVSVQKFSPFSLQTQIVPTSYSVYFDGTGDYLTLPGNSAFAFGTGDFTIECWANLSATGVDDGIIIENRAAGGSTSGFAFNTRGVAGGYKINFYVGGFNITPNSVPYNSWNHIAVTRSSGTVRIFLNGVIDLTATINTNFTDNPITIGQSLLYANSNITGYLSNLRLVKGTALYTANFTPPTAPLTAITNTSLLTCQSTTIIDNSTNAFAITVNGNSQPLPQNPFGYTNPTAGAYTVTALGGSMYFDGTGDYLNLAASSAFDIVSGDFTIQCWVYNSGAGAERYILSQRGAGSGWELRINATNAIQFFFTGGSTLTSTGTIPANSWTHITVTRSTNTVRIFINGVQDSSATFSNGSTAASIALYVGWGTTGGGLFLGYLSDVCIIKGQALYTSNFVPPVAPLDAVRNTTLLLRGTAAGIYDSTMINNLETVGDARINTSVVKFAGKSSIAFDGTGDYLTSPYNATTQEPGSKNLTWEMWINTTSSLQYATLYSRQPGAFTSGMYSLLINSASSTAGDVALWVADYNAGSPLLITTGANIRDGNWHHIAVVRNGSSWVLYVDGTSRATGTWSGAIAALSTAPRIAADQNYTRAYAGYIADLRLTFGIARYTASFTPPTAAFIKY